MVTGGERQQARAWNEVRADHRARYEWANQLIPPATLGADIFCGTGYGTWLLGHSRIVAGFDNSDEALAEARKHWSRPNGPGRVIFAHGDWPAWRSAANANEFITSFESIEHVPDGEALFSDLATALAIGGIICFSSPNEDQLPKLPHTFPFHFKHFHSAELLGWCSRSWTRRDEPEHTSQLELVAWGGQNVYARIERGRAIGLLHDARMRIIPNVEGQFFVGAARRIA